MAKWDGVSTTATAFGSAEGLSNLPVNFSELYYSRLFAAGDADNPGRLYYSQAPGDTRTLENWEQGRAKPNAQAALLIRLVERYPETMDRLASV